MKKPGSACDWADENGKGSCDGVEDVICLHSDGQSGVSRVCQEISNGCVMCYILPDVLEWLLLRDMD